MAVDQHTHWEVRTTGSDLNGGGFSADYVGGTDYSQSDVAPFTYTAELSAVYLSTTLTSASSRFAPNHVGNTIYIASGTGLDEGRYTIVAFTDVLNVVLDRTPAPYLSGSGATGYIGGALQTIQQAVDDAEQGNHIWIKAGTYAGAGPRVVAPNYFGALGKTTRVTGYSTVRGDATTPVVTVEMSSGSGSVIQVGTASTVTSNSVWENINTKGGTSFGWNMTNKVVVVVNCSATDSGSYGFYSASWSQTFIRCGAFNCASYGFYYTWGSRAYACIALDCGSGFLCLRATNTVHCIAAHCTNYGFWIYANGQPYACTNLVNCTSYGNGHGYRLGSGSTENMVPLMINCTAINNTGYGLYDLTATATSCILKNFATFGNGSGGIDTTGLSTFIHDGAPGGTGSEIVLTSQPFIDPENNDFTPRADALQIIEQGYPSSFMTDGAHTGILNRIATDIGAAQRPRSLRKS